jgi:multiple sugar transport system substrate-binding protein
MSSGSSSADGPYCRNDFINAAGVKRVVCIGTAVAVLAIAAAGCGDSSGGAKASGEVQFLTFGDPEELEAFRDVIDGFEAVEPDVKVKLVEASDRDDLIARLSTSIAGGSPPELFLINYRFFGQFAAKGALEELEDRLESSKAFSESDFYAPALDAFRFGADERITCLPQNASSLVVYYNRDLFARYGVAEPGDGWTWKEFTDAAVKLTKDTNGDGKTDLYGAGIEPVLIRLAPFLWSNGANLVKEDLSGFDLATPEAAEVLDEFFKLRVNYQVIPTEEEAQAEDDEARFMNGRAAMLFQSRRAVPALRTITSFDWDVASLPRFKEPTSILHSDAYCMPKDGKNKDAAWKFVEFALGEEGQRIAAEAGRIVPSLRRVAESESFLDPDEKPKRSQVFLDAVEHVRAVPSISTWPEIEDAAEPVLEEAMYEEEASPSEIASRVDATTKAIFARAER